MVIAPDLRGFGQSMKPPHGYDKKTMAKDIHALARLLGVRRASVVGHDIGLMVAYAYAAQYPGEVDRIALMDAFLPGIADRKKLPHDEARKCLTRVDVNRDTVKLTMAVRLQVELTSLRARLARGDQIAARDDILEITLPVRIRKWGGEKVVEGGDGRSASTKAHVDTVLVKALAQAHRWREALSSGAAQSLEDVAAQSRDCRNDSGRDAAPTSHFGSAAQVGTTVFLAGPGPDAWTLRVRSLTAPYAVDARLRKPTARLSSIIEFRSN